MISRIFGSLAIFTGVLWVIWPGILKGWLTRKVGWKLFWLLFGVMAVYLFKWGKVIGVAGVFAALLLFWVMMAGARRGIRSALSEVPPIAFRAAGILNIAFGISLFLR